MATVTWALDDATGAWWVSRLGSSAVRVDLDQQRPDADVIAGPTVVLAFRRDGDERVLSVVDLADGRLNDIHRSPASRAYWAAASRDGRSAYVAWSDEGIDGGVTRIDLAAGRATTLVAGGDLEPEWDRVHLFVSPDGNHVASELCGLTECVIDVAATATGATVRLPAGDALLGVADGQLLSVPVGRSDWRVWDLESLASPEPRAIGAPSDWQLAAIHPLPRGRFVAARMLPGPGTYEVVVIDGARGTESLVARETLVESAGWQVVRALPPVDHWVWIGTDACTCRLVHAAPDGGFTDAGALGALDLTTGTMLAPCSLPFVEP